MVPQITRTSEGRARRPPGRWVVGVAITERGDGAALRPAGDRPWHWPVSLCRPRRRTSRALVLICWWVRPRATFRGQSMTVTSVVSHRFPAGAEHEFGPSSIDSGSRHPAVYRQRDAGRNRMDPAADSRLCPGVFRLDEMDSCGFRAASAQGSMSRPRPSADSTNRLPPFSFAEMRAFRFKPSPRSLSKLPGPDHQLARSVDEPGLLLSPVPDGYSTQRTLRGSSGGLAPGSRPCC